MSHKYTNIRSLLYWELFLIDSQQQKKPRLYNKSLTTSNDRKGKIFLLFLTLYTRDRCSRHTHTPRERGKNWNLNMQPRESHKMFSSVSFFIKMEIYYVYSCIHHFSLARQKKWNEKRENFFILSKEAAASSEIEDYQVCECYHNSYYDDSFMDSDMRKGGKNVWESLNCGSLKLLLKLWWK